MYTHGTQVCQNPKKYDFTQDDLALDDVIAYT